MSSRPTAIAVDPRVGESLAAVRARTPEPARLGIVLGSGLGGFAGRLEGVLRIPFHEIPHFHRTSVPGHVGSLTFGKVARTLVACLEGRLHVYEGYPAEDAALGVRLLAALGCESVILTNAAGGMTPELGPGTFMLLSDHINLTGRNPLVGAPEPFVDMTTPYDLRLAGLARRAASELGEALQEGVYAGVLGPSYETKAEIKMLRSLGAHAVGMSTVLETIALRHLGVAVGAMSCITNWAAGMSPRELHHGEVQATARAVGERFSDLLSRWIALAVAEGAA